MTSKNYATILVQVTNNALHITLNNPAKKNAIGPVMVNELLDALAFANEEPSICAIVLTGAGDAFCAGGDFSQMASASTNNDIPYRGDYADLLRTMMRFSKPIVARVQGVAMGGGLGLVAASHFAIASKTAIFATPEINVGLFPMMIMAVLARTVSRRKLLEMMLLGKKWSAVDAEQMDLITRAVEPEMLEGAVAELVDGLVKKSPMAMKLGLTAYADQLDMPLDEALPMLRGRLGQCLATDDAREGLMAFLEKRPPVWSGK